MPRLALLSLSVLLAAVGARASLQSEAPPNSLTTAEVAAGWILLFDGTSTFGWQPRGEAKWEVVDGALQPTAGGGRGFLATTTHFADFRLRAEFWADSTANSGVFLRCPPDGEINQSLAYEVNIFDRHPLWPTGSINDVARVSGRPSTTGRWNTLDITARGDRLTVLLNGRPAVDAFDRRYARGPIALQTNGPGVVRFRNVKLQPLSLHSLFNGRDLTGWRVLPGRRSVYSVTPEGWLNVKDGNGDMQSENAYGDFVFQLDVLSNGTHLNSGIFFRGDPGQFWSGYESQIRNQWVGEDRTNPVDFGTGGVYNQQRARRVVSSDREWFTKTIVAHGPHIAVWVNGIQVSDFTDRRPASDNARQGYRARAGVLSIQGHDPATDLSFRSLRITELPARTR